MKKDFPLAFGEATYNLRFNFAALTTIEDLTGLPFATVFTNFIKGSMKNLQTLLYVGLKHNHPDIKMDSLPAIIDEADNLLSVRQGLIDAINGSLESSTKKKTEPEV